MAREKKCPECPPVGAPPWMATFSDLMTLLLTFFVLLISMSTMEVKKFAMAMTSLQGALGVLPGSAGNTLAITAIPMFQVGKGQVDQLLNDQVNKITEQLAMANIADLMNVQKSKDVLRISIAEGLLFDSGQAIIKATADTFLVGIAEILNIVPFEIRIEGHTDNIPIHTVRFPSNWELSYARALALGLKFAECEVNPDRFQLIGHGDQRPKADNSTPEGRSINRRVEIEVNLKDDVRKSLVPGE
ncbi:MAG: flagellar motor protein MotB [Candidatus Cloacimonetes bacterium]|nr:flagellar motor protein MotB [Candidatus Cloacimonadota bacterium]